MSNDYDIVRFNVKGRLFMTKKQTLLSPGSSFFSAVLTGSVPLTRDENGYYFIDRSPEYFDVVLDVLQYGFVDCPRALSKQRLDVELDYYGLSSFVNFRDDTQPLSNNDMAVLLQKQKDNDKEHRFRFFHEELTSVSTKIFSAFRTLAAHPDPPQGEYFGVRFFPEPPHGGPSDPFHPSKVYLPSCELTIFSNEVAVTLSRTTKSQGGTQQYTVWMQLAEFLEERYQLTVTVTTTQLKQYRLGSQGATYWRIYNPSLERYCYGSPETDVHYTSGWFVCWSKKDMEY